MLLHTRLSSPSFCVTAERGPQQGQGTFGLQVQDGLSFFPRYRALPKLRAANFFSDSFSARSFGTAASRSGSASFGSSLSRRLRLWPRRSAARPSGSSVRQTRSQRSIQWRWHTRACCLSITQRFLRRGFICHFRNAGVYFLFGIPFSLIVRPTYYAAYPYCLIHGVSSGLKRPLYSLLQMVYMMTTRQEIAVIIRYKGCRRRKNMLFVRQPLRLLCI